MMKSLRDQVSTLTSTEKIELIEAAWESLEADLASLTAEQKSELDVRWARSLENPEQVIPWQRVKESMFQKQ